MSTAHAPRESTSTSSATSRERVIMGRRRNTNTGPGRSPRRRSELGRASEARPVFADARYDQAPAIHALHDGDDVNDQDREPEAHGEQAHHAPQRAAHHADDAGDDH